MPLLGKVVVLDLARCEEVGDARRGKLRREHVVLTPKGGGVYFILFSSFHLHMQRFGFCGFRNVPTPCVNTANEIQTRKWRILHSPFFSSRKNEVRTRHIDSKKTLWSPFHMSVLQLLFATIFSPERRWSCWEKKGAKKKKKSWRQLEARWRSLPNILILHFIYSRTS